MARHFLDLAGAATLETESYLLAQRAVADAVEACAMAVLHGGAGLGKTYAVEDALAAPAVRVVWVSFPSRPTPRLIAATLHEELTGRETRLDRFAIIRRLVDELSSAPAIVVVDESQLLTSDCIELLRYLHDHRSTRFALVLVGGNGTWRVLSREPMLASRVYRRDAVRTAHPRRRPRGDPGVSPDVRRGRSRLDRARRRRFRARQPAQLGRVHRQRTAPTPQARP
ncbi:MAG: ATP-binding protein [Actinobacteria bacterium]|nr:ATP-binding protein [Actinomycetota bacterium]